MLIVKTCVIFGGRDDKCQHINGKKVSAKNAVQSKERKNRTSVLSRTEREIIFAGTANITDNKNV